MYRTLWNGISWDMFSNKYNTYLPIYDDTQQLIMEKILNIYLNRFTYTDLPDEMEEAFGGLNYIDLILFFNPSGSFFKSEKYGIQYLPTTGAYKFNLIGRPVQWTVYGYNGFTQVCSDDNAVLTFNDKARTIPMLHMMYESEFMRDLDKTIKQNIFAQRQPYVFEGTEDTMKSVQAYYEQLRDFMPILLKRKHDKRNTETIDTQVFNTQVPLQVDPLNDAYAEFFNRCLTYLGINNINVQNKRERLITAEASANDILIQSYYTSAYETREKQIEKCNKMFGTHIKFEATELKTLVMAINNEYQNAIAMAENKGVNGNGESNPSALKSQADT